MLRRLVFLTLTALATVLLASAQPARAVDVPTNDVTLDMESGVPLIYPFGLSVFNLYWDTDWNTHNPGFARSSIDAATMALTDSNYFDKAAQYGAPDLTFSGSAEAAGVCGGTPGTTTNSVALILFLLCEEATPFTGVPYSSPLFFADRIYNVIVPTGTTIDDVVAKSCANYSAYHFIFPSLGGIPFGVPPPGRPIIFTVIPAKCVSDVAGLMASISHEDVEATTDPEPIPPFQSWIDDSTVDTMSLGSVLGTLLNPLKAGEAADICNNGVGFKNVPVSFGGIAMQVGAYWSNADNACVVGTSRVVSMSFAATGVPSSLATVDVGGTTRSLPSSTPELEGTSFTFPAMITDPSHADVRYVRTGCTGGPASGTVTFPAGNVTANASASISCAYSRAAFVRIATAPAAAATGNVSLTSSQWVTAGTILTVNADATVAAGAGSRYDFRYWSDGSVLYSTPTASYVITSPVTITATYQLQHRVDFDQTGIPANGTMWHVTIDGAVRPGPAFKWVDEGGSVSYSYESPVADALDYAKRYVLSGVAPPSPHVVLAPETVTGTYDTQSSTLLIGTKTLARSGIDTDAAGRAESFKATATASGTVDVVFVYVDSTNTATQLVAGLYTDNAGHPGTLLSQGTLLGSPTNGAFNPILVPSVPLVAGKKYWISILSPFGSPGVLKFRDHCCGYQSSLPTGPSENSKETNLAGLPASWTTGKIWPNDGPLLGWGGVWGA